MSFAFLLVKPLLDGVANIVYGVTVHANSRIHFLYLLYRELESALVSVVRAGQYVFATAIVCLRVLR